MWVKWTKYSRFHHPQERQEARLSGHWKRIFQAPWLLFPSLGQSMFICFCELGGAAIETWRNSRWLKFQVLKCCLLYSLRCTSAFQSRDFSNTGNCQIVSMHAPFSTGEKGSECEVDSIQPGAQAEGLGAWPLAFSSWLCLGLIA